MSPSMHHFEVIEGEEGALLLFVSTKLKISKKAAKRLLDAKKVFVNGKRIWMAQSPVRVNDVVEVQFVPSSEKKRTVNKPEILFEDDSYIIVNKPSGIITNGPDSLENVLRDVLESKDICAVHRLDKDTTGCVLFARTRAIKEKTEEVFRQKKIEKIYHAISKGQFPYDVEVIRKPIEGRQARTEVSIITSNSVASHLRLRILTGRMHQIRKHLTAVRSPIVGDKDYQVEAEGNYILRSVPRQMLHAKSLKFISPFNEKTISADARLPNDFVACLKAVGLD